MEKLCKCGQSMNIGLRTVIYLNKVEIENVPVYTCDSCSRSEVFPGVKHELTDLIGELGSHPEKRQLHFEDLNELSHLMMKVTGKEHRHQPVSRILEERINELLDMLLLARSLGDQDWAADVRQRLHQLTNHAVHAHELKA